MNLESLRSTLQGCPLIASVQSSEGSPASGIGFLLSAALTHRQEGVRVLRLEGAEAIRSITEATGLPSIGLIKRRYEGTDVYITASAREVDEAIRAGAAIIALDGTARVRPNGDRLEDLIARIHAAGRLAMADIDSVSSAQYAVAAGADLVGTTLGGYTPATPLTDGPDLELLRSVVAAVTVPVIAEGRYSERWHVDVAMRMGVAAVVVGGALNDPLKQTRALKPSPGPASGDRVGAVDIGGTWLRFGLFGEDWSLKEVVRAPNPRNRTERVQWIRDQVQQFGVTRLGVSTGGIIDPQTGHCWTAKEYLMPDHIGIEFNEATLGVPTYAHGDGHASAWAHACLPGYAGLRVATLALGTGVGCGFVRENQIWCGRRGEYPRINDLPGPGGKSYEDLLGGINLTRTPDPDQQANAILALEGALKAIRDLYFPDEVFVCGSVGMSDWLAPHVERLGARISPLGADAGLYGAAALAFFPGYR